jgi:NAD(P)-dependent dehydrogenase (short-subunit alcohol dehydrogenase family)
MATFLDPQPLRGKVALITGASRGIGRSIAELYAAAGAAVCMTARKTEELDRAVAAVQKQGGVALAYVGSAAVPAHIDESVERCVSELGSLDILVNCAATNPQYGPLVEADPESVAKVWQVNQEGPLRHVQAAWRAWMASHGGVVLNVASLGGICPTPMIGSYTISKAALIHMTRQLALELAPTVRVNAVAPAVVKTRFARVFWEDHEEELAGQYPMARLGTPEDVAGAALFLVSDAASWITGQVLILDGGASTVPVGAGIEGLDSSR